MLTSPRRLLLLVLTSMFVVALCPAQQPSRTRAATTSAPSATAAAGATKLPSEDVVNAFMRQMFGYDASLSWKIVDIKPSPAEGLAEVNMVITSPQGSQSSRLYVSSDGRHAVAGEILPFGTHPFADAAAKLKDATGPSQGPAAAPVTIVEFSDMQCPHCKAAQPILAKLLADESNVRLVFQAFPLSGHDWAEKAAEYGDCVARASNDAYWKFIASVFEAQAEITASAADEKLTALADQAGVKGADIAACAAKPETTGRVQRSVLLGQSVNVTATPTLFVNGRKIDNAGAVPYEFLKKMVEFAAGESKAAEK